MNTNYFTSIGFSLCALLFVILMLIMYYGKEKPNNIENKLFAILSYAVITLIFIEFEYTHLLIDINKHPTLTNIMCRTYLIGIIVWMGIMEFYVLVQLTRTISDVELKKKKRKQLLIILSAFVLSFIIYSCFLDIEYYDYTDRLYTFGGRASYPAFLMGFLGFASMIYGFIFKNKELTLKQKKPLIYCILFILGITIIQLFAENADYNIQNFQFASLLMALFFTLENQDNKLLKQHEEQKTEAIKANKEQTEFLTSMSHEIRTPMSTIMGFSEMLIREGAQNQIVVKNDTKYIHSAAVSLLDLINNILDLSRIESGKETVVEGEFETASYFVDLNESIKSKINPYKATYRIRIDENIPSKLYGDSVKVNKIVLNLINNISRYTESGLINLLIQNVSINNEFKLRFSVISSGSEIPDEEYKKYYLNRDDNKLNSAILDLNVAEMYANMLQTKIINLNNSRENISFCVDISFQIIEPKPIGDIKPLLYPTTTNVSVGLEGKRILVVDDNLVNIKLLCRLLKDYNFDITTCSSGFECIEKVRDNDYDIIFLDHMMPGMDGVETLNSLRNLKSSLPPIIALTANNFSNVKETYIGLGFTDYLAKPINKNELNKILNYIKK